MSTNEEGVHLILAMTAKCRRVIQDWPGDDSDAPQAFRRAHLLWMCEQLDLHARHGPATKLHRWLGFIQAALLSNRMLDLAGLKAMFNEAKATHDAELEDQEDLLDHLDPASSFEFDIGGQG